MAEIHYSPRVSIRVRYIGPSNYRGSRFRVFRADGTYNDDPDRIEVPFDHGASYSQRPVDAVGAYLAKKDESWQGRWVVAGANDREYIAVNIAGVDR